MLNVWASPRCGKTHSYKQLTFYACEGLIALEDGRDGSGKVLTPTEFENNAKALWEYARKMRGSQRGHERDEYYAASKGLQHMEDAIREARDMGDPSDPSVAEWIRKHVLGRKDTISMAKRLGATDPGGYPELPPIDSRISNTVATGNIVGAATGRVIKPHATPTRKPRLNQLLSM